MPCSICHQIGHNKKTCPGTVPTAPEPPTAPTAPPVVCAVCSEEKDLYKKGRCLECHKARKAAKKAEKAENTIHLPDEKEETKSVDSAGSDNKQPWTEVVKKGRSFPAPSPKQPSNTRANIIFHMFKNLITDMNTLEYYALREMYYYHPERFSVFDMPHVSKEDTFQHYTIEAFVPFVGYWQPDQRAKFDRKASFHLNFTVKDGKKQFTSFTVARYSPTEGRTVIIELATFRPRGWSDSDSG
jgi:hypothetical protein